MKAFQDITKPPWTQRRMLGATMLAEGHPITKVTTELGLSHATARRYQAIYAVRGRDGLLPLGDVGRQHLLDRESFNWVTSTTSLNRSVLPYRSDMAIAGRSVPPVGRA